MEASQRAWAKDALQHGNSFMAPPIQPNELAVPLGSYLAIGGTGGFVHQREPEGAECWGFRSRDQRGRKALSWASEQPGGPPGAGCGDGEARGEDVLVGRREYLRAP